VHGHHCEAGQWELGPGPSVEAEDGPLEVAIAVLSRAPGEDAVVVEPPDAFERGIEGRVGRWSLEVGNIVVAMNGSSRSVGDVDDRA